jgi:nucleobase:cation symporter-1, NCS1 family
MPDHAGRPLEHEREELEEALHVERHNSILPVPERFRDATPLHQFWIWGGANIAPINWVLGALAIVLGLGFWDTVIALAVGNLLGMALFGSFVLMGQRTGVTQMVLSRSAFGRRGGYLPALFQILIPTGWIAINTWIILDLGAELLDQVGIPGTDLAKVVLVLVIMGVQVGLATLGFYATARSRSGRCRRRWSCSWRCRSSRGRAATSSGTTPASSAAASAGRR